VASLPMGHWGTCPPSSFGISVYSAAAVSSTVRILKITKEERVMHFRISSQKHAKTVLEPKRNPGQGRRGKIYVVLTLTSLPGDATDHIPSSNFPHLPLSPPICPIIPVFYHVHPKPHRISPPLTLGQGQNMTKVYLIIAKTVRHRKTTSTDYFVKRLWKRPPYKERVRRNTLA